MSLNIELWSAIKKKYKTQKEFSKIVGQHYTQVSQAVNGHINLSLEMKKKYALALDKMVEELFG